MLDTKTLRQPSGYRHDNLLGVRRCLRHSNARLLLQLTPELWRKVRRIMISASTTTPIRLPPLEVHRSPVRNCARPAPNDQSSSAFVTKFTTTSVGEIRQLAESLSPSKRQKACFISRFRGRLVIWSTTILSDLANPSPVSSTTMRERLCSCTT